MHIEQANSTVLSAVLKKIGLSPIERKGHELWYCSPFRKEKMAGFHINTLSNTWHDAHLKRGGKVIDFVCSWLQYHEEDHTIPDALRWLDNLRLPEPAICFAQEDIAENPAALTLHKASPLRHASLVAYLDAKGISLSLAKRYLKEIHAHNAATGNDFCAVGIINEDGGYEVKNTLFKGCIFPQTVSFIRGAKYPPEEVHIFEDFTDFLAALAYRKESRLEGDAIILHRLACLRHALPYVRNYPSYKRLYTWMNNDHMGKKATQSLKAFAGHEGLTFKAMNRIYAPHRNVSLWHKENLHR
ncbi:MAG: hypothetical protein JSS82_09935 [Bacteroidetes bacterium]|nr:hypothetical protein [Bacteroidota bacterium]